MAVRIGAVFRAIAFAFKAYRTWVAGVAGYLIGSLMLEDAVRRVAHARDDGPADAGMADMRTRRDAAVVLAGDIVKGAVGARVGRAIGGDAGAYAAGIGTVAGQCFPAFAEFRGGKAIGTWAGTALACFPAALPVIGGLAGLGYAKLRRPGLVVAIAGGAFALASMAWWRAGWPAGRRRKASAGLPVYGLAASALVVWQALREREETAAS